MTFSGEIQFYHYLYQLAFDVVYIIKIHQQTQTQNAPFGAFNRTRKLVHTVGFDDNRNLFFVSLAILCYGVNW